MPSLSSGIHAVGTVLGLDVPDKVGSRKHDEEAVHVDAFVAACQKGDLATVLLMWAQGHDLGEQDASGFTPLHWAAYKEELEVVLFLLDKGADPNKLSHDGQSPLHWAAIEDAVEIVDALVKAGAKVHVQDDRGYTAMFIACQYNSLKTLHYLATADNEFDVNEIDGDGHTMLHWAAYTGHIRCIQYCVEVIGVDPTIVDKERRTALHWAAREGREEACRYLVLHCGLNAGQMDADAHTPLAWARTRNHTWTCDALQDPGNSVPMLCKPCAAVMPAFMVPHKKYLRRSVWGFIFPFVGLIASHIVLPFGAHFLLCFYVGKNLLFQTLDGLGIMAVNTDSDIEVPRSIVETLKGPKSLNYRESGNFTAVIAVALIQLFEAAQIGILSPSMLLLAAAALVAALVCKASAKANVVANVPIAGSPFLKAIDNREFCRLKPRIYPPEFFIQAPLRSYHCKETGEIVRKFDHYSLLLDTAVGRYNHRSYMVHIIAFFALEALVTFTAFTHIRAAHCSNTPFGVCTFVWGMLVASQPCSPTDFTYLNYVLPPYHVGYGLWLISYGAIMAGLFLFLIVRQLNCICSAVTRQETRDSTAPNAKGEMVSIYRGSRSVYAADLGPASLLLQFFAGVQGARWDNEYFLLK